MDALLFIMSHEYASVITCTYARVSIMYVFNSTCSIYENVDKHRSPI